MISITRLLFHCTDDISNRNCGNNYENHSDLNNLTIHRIIFFGNNSRFSHIKNYKFITSIYQNMGFENKKQGPFRKK